MITFVSWSNIGGITSLDVATASDLYIDMSLANEDWQPGGNTPWGSNNGGE